ncbi:hypothetical protein Pcinc_006740 [Petrolisthes cinctipes]|uniref:Endonuclease/exonuclease/phosphatase domain-containing protein n=1 Tax=Petrolisthes cinctipes TaxID=88211 RepID=A0AAE1GC47_PETCI|nr:hypothetical protein Pcinc_006740 [Petrolisthes cinctipes]
MRKNKILTRHIHNILQKHEEEPLVLLGNFNGHFGFIGRQEVNQNGNRVLSWAEKYYLTILNGDLRCKGETTWSRGEQSSAIDFILVNQTVYEKFCGMEIDEEGKHFDLSDHNQICATFNITVTKPYKEKSEVKEISYLKINDTTKHSFMQCMEDKLRSQAENLKGNIIQLENMMKDMANTHMITKLRKRTKEEMLELIEPI